MSIAHNLRALRIRAGLTQGQLAERLGVSTTAVTHWELGNTRPRAERLADIARALGTSMGGLLEETGPGGDLPAAPQPLIPLVGTGDLLAAHVEVPSFVAAAHPGARAMVVPDESMARVMHEGMAAVYDPALTPATGQLAVVTVEGGNPFIRRWLKGTNTVLLAAEGYEPHPDIVIEDEDEIAVLGTVVWVQPIDMLA